MATRAYGHQEGQINLNIERGGTGIERGGTGVERGGTGVERGGTGVERGGTGIDKGGSGICRNPLRRVVLAGMLVAGMGTTGAVMADNLGLSPMSSWDVIGEAKGTAHLQAGANGTAKLSMLLDAGGGEQLMLVGTGMASKSGYQFSVQEMLSNADLSLKGQGLTAAEFGRAELTINSCSSVSVDLFISDADKTANSGSGGKTANSGSGGRTANSGSGELLDPVAARTANSGSGSKTANSGSGGKTANSGSGGKFMHEALFASVDLYAMIGGACAKTANSGSGG